MRVVVETSPIHHPRDGGNDVEMQDESVPSDPTDQQNQLTPVDPAVLHSRVIDDLSSVRGSELKKLPEKDVAPYENKGLVYAPIFRQLQIKPSEYSRFYSGVIRFVRQKHWADIKRGTDASLRNITSLLLRGLGYLVWPLNSTWLLDDNELAEGEERLVHVRHAENSENDVFYPIFEQLWRQMRNILFDRKPEPKKQSGTHFGRSGIDLEDAYLADADTDYNPTTAPPSPFSVARNRSQQQLENLMADRGYNLPHPKTPHNAQYTDDNDLISTDRQMTPDETSNAIVSLISRLSFIRARSDPSVFAETWTEHIERIGEIDDAEKPIQSIENDRPSFQLNQGGLSNYPFLLHGNPVTPTLLHQQTRPPTLPREMAVYISASYSTITQPAFQTHPDGMFYNHLTAAPNQHQKAYVWPSAPVTAYDCTAFFKGIEMRISPPSTPNMSEYANKKILGWSLSYGWNDSGRFIYNDNDTDTPQVFEGGHTSKRTPGWIAFQNDLVDAAVKGVKVWRMKCLVVYA